jgi:5-oxoprolinase (ATP-hydrolysing)
MLKDLSLKWGLKEVDTVRAIDYMDDGSELKLALTIDRHAMTAHFDFEVINIFALLIEKLF